MKIVKETDKTILFLEDQEVLEVQTLKGNPLNLRITCQNGSLIVNEFPIKKLKEWKLEKESIQKLKTENKS